MFDKPENWDDLSIEEKRTIRLEAWASTEGRPFGNQEAKEKYMELAALIKDAVGLKKAPERVSVYLLGGDYPMKHAGIPLKAAIYDGWNDVAEVAIDFHKGDDYHMSDEQFEKFYWFTFKKSLFLLINESLIPLAFAEGSYNRRLDCIKELPKASTVWLFDRTDMHRTKDVLVIAAVLWVMSLLL